MFENDDILEQSDDLPLLNNSQENVSPPRKSTKF